MNNERRIEASAAAPPFPATLPGALAAQLATTPGLGGFPGQTGAAAPPTSPPGPGAGACETRTEASVPLFQRPSVLGGLLATVTRLSRGSGDQADAWQDACILLWKAEQAQPGMTDAWYVRECIWRLKDEGRKGHSIDSPKRQWARSALPVESDDPHFQAEEAQLSPSSADTTCTREFLRTLLLSLKAEDRQLLDLIGKGRSQRQIAVELHITQPAVSQRFRAIKELDRRLRRQ